MAAHPPLPGLAKVTMTFLCSGRNFGDSFYLMSPGSAPWTPTFLALCSTTLTTQWTTHLAPLTSSSCSLVKVTTLDLSDTAGRFNEHDATVPGTVTASPPLPLNAVARITWAIPRRYRGGRPGLNVSGRVMSQTADERLFNVADNNALLDATVAMIGGLVAVLGSGYDQVAVSYFLDKVARAVPLALPVIGAEIQERICTLRKRLGKSVAELFG